MPNHFNVSLYIRVSTGRQANEGDSLEEQEKELKKFCDYKGYLIHKTHIERGRSAKDTKRPEYQRLLKDVAAGAINAVIVKKLDRLSRSLLDFEEFMKTAQQNDVEFISLKESFDTTNSIGKAMLRVALVFAQLEREQTSERICDVFAYRAENGQYNGGLRPFGYDTLGSELSPHKQNRKVIELIFDKFLEAKSTAKVAHEINALGLRNRNGKLWDKRQVHKILKRPIYAGFVKWHGTLHKGIHQPLVPETKYNLVQNIFASKDYVSPRNKVSGLLKGFLVCGYCQNNLSPNYTRKKSGKFYHYYRCASTFNPSQRRTDDCKNQYLPSDKTHELVKTALLGYSTEAMLTKIKQELAAHNRSLQKAIDLLKAEQDKLEAQLAKVKQKSEKYLDSLMSGTFSNSERQKINAKIDEFALEEKQIQSAIYRQEIELAEKQDRLQTIEPFKQAIIQFKVNQNQMTETEYRDWLKANVEHIQIRQDQVSIRFKNLVMT